MNLDAQVHEVAVPIRNRLTDIAYPLRQVVVFTVWDVTHRLPQHVVLLAQDVLLAHHPVQKITAPFHLVLNLKSAPVVLTFPVDPAIVDRRQVVAEHVLLHPVMVVFGIPEIFPVGVGQNLREVDVFLSAESLDLR